MSSHFLSSTIQLEAGCGTFSSICSEAKAIVVKIAEEFHIKNTVVEFKFNDILFRVNQNTDINKAWEHYVKMAKVKAL